MLIAPTDRFFPLAVAAFFITGLSCLAGLAVSYLPPAGRRWEKSSRLLLGLVVASFVLFFSWKVSRRLITYYQAFDSSYFLLIHTYNLHKKREKV